MLGKFCDLLKCNNNDDFSDYEESALDRVLQAAFADADGTGKLTFDLDEMIDYTTDDFYR